MEVLACIPELRCPANPIVTAVGEPVRSAELTSRGISTAAPSLAAAASEADDADDEAFISPSPRRRSDRRSRAAALFSPSVIALAALAVVVWTAAWRNDRLRLEATRQQRPERLAQQVQATAGPTRSVTP